MKKTYCKYHILCKIFFLVIFLNSPSILIAQTDLVSDQIDYKQDISDFMEHYYRDPDPEMARRKLEQFLKSDEFKKIFKNQRSWLNQVAYFYGRVGMSYPPIRNYYMINFDTSGYEGRIFLLDVLRISGDAEVAEYLRQKSLNNDFRNEREAINQTLQVGIPLKVDIEDRKITRNFDLQLLWTEYSFSANTEILTPIFNTLALGDLMRVKLDEYLVTAPSPRRRQLIADLVKKDLRLSLNQDETKITSIDDVDIVFGSLLGTREEARVLRRIRRALFIDAKEIEHARLKATALSQLKNKLRAHPSLLEAVAEKSLAAHSSIQVLLFPMLADFYYDKGSYAEAVEMLQKLSQFKPGDYELQRKLGLAALFADNFELASQVLAELKQQDERRYRELKEYFEFAAVSSLPVVDRAVEVDDSFKDKVVSVCRNLRSYSSEMRFLGPYNDHIPKQETLYWKIDYEAPSSYAVAYKPKYDDPTRERWIQSGARLFLMSTEVPVWREDRDASHIANKKTTNAFLAINKWCSLIENHQAIFIGQGVHAEMSFYFAQFKGESLSEFPDSGISEVKSFELQLWLDRTSLYLLKANIVINGANKQGQNFNVKYEQTFRLHNQPIVIRSPQVEAEPEAEETDSTAPFERI